MINQAPDQVLTKPLRTKKPTLYFVNSMADLFHEDVPDEWIDRVFAVMALCPQHSFQVLTKRAARMRAYLQRYSYEEPEPSGIADAAAELLNVFDWGRCGSTSTSITTSHQTAHGWTLKEWPLPNVHMGVSAEDQARANERIHELRHTPAAVRFVSYEPALGPIDFTRTNDIDTVATDVLRGVRVDPKTMLHVPGDEPLAPLDWVIVGGESGPDARPCYIEWIRSAVAQCRAASVPVFVKQMGARPIWPKAERRALADAKGGNMAEWPPDLQIREMPTIR